MINTILTRVTGLRNPPPPPTKEQRLATWAYKYHLIPLDQRLMEKRK